MYGQTSNLSFDAQKICCRHLLCDFVLLQLWDFALKAKLLGKRNHIPRLYIFWTPGKFDECDIELLSIYKKIRNGNTVKRIKIRAWCQYSRAIIMGLFFSRASVFVSQVKTSGHFSTYPHEETGGWNPHLLEDQPCFFSSFCVFQVAVSQRTVYLSALCCSHSSLLPAQLQ